MIKKKISNDMSKNNKNCKLIFEKNNNFGLIKAKNVSMHKEIQITESVITDLKFLKLFNIQKQDLIYINIM